MGGESNLVIGGLGMNQLVTLAHGAHIEVRHRPVENHPVVIKVFQKA